MATSSIGWAVGLDMGGTKCLGVLLDPHGVVKGRHLIPTPLGADNVVAALTSTAEALRAQSPEPIQAVGCGVPGLMTHAGVLRYAPHLPGVIDLPLQQLLGDSLTLPVIVDNDNTCATWAEYRAREGGDPLLYVGFGTGIGGGFVIDGQLRRGGHGFAGEIGHMVVQADGPRCVCGRRGCWELYASGSAIGRLAGEKGLNATGVEVRSMYRLGDPVAIEVINEFARYVALGIINLVLTLDAQTVVLGGGAIGEPEHAEEILAPIRRHLVDQFGAAAGHRPIPELRASHYGPVAGAVGAAMLARAYARTHTS
jgi:glucokinase